MSEKSQAGHVDIYNDPLPSPLTTRNLRPRLSQSLARAAYRDASRSQRSSSDFSSQRTTPHRLKTPAMQSNGEASTSSSNAGSPSRNQSAGSPGLAARSRKRQAKRRRVTTPEDISTSEEGDQISPDSDDIPIAQSISDSPSRMGTQATSGPSTSSGIAGLSSSAYQPDLSHVSVSSPSLRKILHPTNIEPFQKLSPTPEPIASSSSAAQAYQAHVSLDTPPPAPEPLADYTCPICFFPPTNATLTPCGHICCGSCLFMAVKSALQRATLVNDAGANVARCPVCRAPIPGWDGRGGGVIGLKARTLLTL